MQMQLEIEHEIRAEVARLNETANRILRRHNKPNARLIYAGTCGKCKGEPTFQLRWPNTRTREILFKDFTKTGKHQQTTKQPLDQWTHGIMHHTEHFYTHAANGNTSIASHSDALVRRIIIDELQLYPQKRVMELGPGNGELLEMALSRGANVTAVDHSLAIARRITSKFKTAVQSGNLNVAHAQFTELPNLPWWRHGQLTAVYSLASTDLHPQPDALFKVVRAALKPGGKFVIAEITPLHSELTSRLKKAGFRIKKVKVIPLMAQCKLKGG
ncbi:MAG: methyltransferase domain-containing protein, partial [Candidatus Micrarchaeota archaeon]